MEEVIITVIITTIIIVVLELIIYNILKSKFRAIETISDSAIKLDARL